MDRPPHVPQPETELEEFFDLSIDPLSIIGFDGEFKRVNASFLRLLGYTQQELFSRTALDNLHPDDVEEAREALAHLAEGHDLVGYEVRVVCADGSVRWLEWNTRSMPERGVLYGVARDTTERRRVDAELREAQRLLEASRDELRVLADEQAALRRVATLVAQDVPSSELFGAVAREVGTLVGPDFSGMIRYEDDASVTTVATWAAAGEHPPVPTRWDRELGDPASIIEATREPARVDDWTSVPGSMATFIRSELGVSSSVACPIVVEGRLWGALAVHSKQSRPLPPDTESRVAQFTDLVATAIANAEARGRADRLAEEQAALRRVAVLVAQQSSPSEVFTAVTQAVGLLLDADLAVLHVFQGDGTARTIASWSGGGPVLPIGTRFPLDGDNLAARIYESGAPERMHSDDEAWTRAATNLAQSLRVRSAVGAPILVEGKLWGALMAATGGVGSWAENAETRLAAFTELVATAIANADSRDQLTASRARLLTAGDEARRRVVRDLHDGAQQRLVHAIVTLKLAWRAVRDNHGEVESLLGEALEYAEQGNRELRDLAHGILPPRLTHGGLRAGVDAVVERVDLPVQVDVPNERYPAEIEATAYFIVAEALTNVVKHSQAGAAKVTAYVQDGTLHVEIRDDGSGGANPDGHGLVGMRDRVTTLGGRLEIDSPDGDGTRVAASLPLSAR